MLFSLLKHYLDLLYTWHCTESIPICVLFHYFYISWCWKLFPQAVGCRHLWCYFFFSPFFVSGLLWFVAVLLKLIAIKVCTCTKIQDKSFTFSSHFGYGPSILSFNSIVYVDKRSVSIKTSSQYFSKMLLIPKHRAYRSILKVSVNQKNGST